MANRGQKIEILDDGGNLLYPRTSGDMVLFGNNGDTVGGKLGDALTDIGNLQTSVGNLEAEIGEARNTITTNYPTLRARLDAIEDKIGTGGGGGNNPQVQLEVEEARKDKNGNVHQNLKERLDDDFTYLDEKFDNYLPLTGGNVDALTIGGNHVWHAGNFNPSDKRDNLRPSTVNWFAGTPIILDDGRMSIAKFLDFHETQNSIYTYDIRLLANGDYVQSNKGLAAGGNVVALGNYYVANNRGIIFTDSQGNDGFGITNYLNDTLEFGNANRRTRIVGNGEVFVQNAILTSNFGHQIGGWFTGESGTEYRRKYDGVGNFATKQFATVQNIDLNQPNNLVPSHTIEVYKYNDDGTSKTLDARYFFEKNGIYMGQNFVGVPNLGSTSRQFKAVYCVDGVIQSSDMNRKTDIRDIDDTIFYNLLKNTGVHSYVLKYDGVPDNITQETAPRSQVHIGVVAQEMEQHSGAEYILDKCQVDEDGTEEFFLNNYNYSSAIHAGLKVLIGKHEMLEYEVKQLKTKLSNETTRRKELEQIVEDLTA